MLISPQVKHHQWGFHFCFPSGKEEECQSKGEAPLAEAPEFAISKTSPFQNVDTLLPQTGGKKTPPKWPAFTFLNSLKVFFNWLKCFLNLLLTLKEQKMTNPKTRSENWTQKQYLSRTKSHHSYRLISQCSSYCPLPRKKLLRQLFAALRSLCLLCTGMNDEQKMHFGCF